MCPNCRFGPDGLCDSCRRLEAVEKAVKDLATPLPVREGWKCQLHPDSEWVCTHPRMGIWMCVACHDKTWPAEVDGSHHYVLQDIVPKPTRTLDEVRREAIKMTLEKFGTLKSENHGVGVENVMANLRALDRLKLDTRREETCLVCGGHHGSGLPCPTMTPTSGTQS